jgi:anion-transporting  ArsA/GET3 family ATPase
LEEAYDLISTSPAKSAQSVRSLEENIIQEIRYLINLDPNTDAAEMLKSIEMIISKATKRNIKLQLENRQ